MNRTQKIITIALLLLGTNINVFADFSDGMKAYKKGDYKTAYKELKPLAEQGNTSAQVKIAWIYAVGLGIEKNIELGIKWMTNAAELGDTEAQNLLAVMYSGSSGGEIENREKEFKWHMKAAEQGHAESQLHIGAAYRDGDFVPKNTEKAIYWSNKSLKNGHRLANIILSGIYLEKGDKTKAILYLNNQLKAGGIHTSITFFLLSEAHFPENISKASQYARKFFIESESEDKKITEDFIKAQTGAYKKFILNEYKLFQEDSKKSNFILTCSLEFRDGDTIDQNFLVNFKRKSIDNNPAEITDSEIKFNDEKIGTIINRLTGRIHILSLEMPSAMISGNCKKYTNKKF